MTRREMVLALPDTAQLPAAFVKEIIREYDAGMIDEALAGQLTRPALGRARDEELACQAGGGYPPRSRGRLPHLARGGLTCGGVNWRQ